MKNTIITSISAIIFLVIGLFIGKSNRMSGYNISIKENKLTKIELRREEVPHKIKNLKLKIIIDETATNIIEYKSIHDKIELESMRLGFHFCQTNELFDAYLTYRIYVRNSNDSGLIQYTSSLSLDKTVEFEISKNRYSKKLIIWETEHFGMFDRETADDFFLKEIQTSLDELSRSFLKSKEKYN